MDQGREAPIEETHPLSPGAKTEYPDDFDSPFKCQNQSFFDPMSNTSSVTDVTLNYKEKFIQSERKKTRVTELESTVTEPETEPKKTTLELEHHKVEAGTDEQLKEVLNNCHVDSKHEDKMTECNLVNLPPDIILRIINLCRAADLHNLKTVCKTFYNIIIDPEMGIVPQRRALILHYVIYFDAKDIDLNFLRVRRHQLPRRINRISCELGGSCRGKVLYVRWFEDDDTRFYKCYLWDIVSGDIFKVEGVGFPEESSLFSYGFGYDNNTNDFKIVRMLEIPRGIEIRVYDKKSNRWSVPATYYNGDTHPIDTYGKVINNHIVHWIFQHGITQEYSLRGYDVETNNWIDLHLPVMEGNKVPRDLGVLDGCLCVVCGPYYPLDKRQCTDVWVMRDYENDQLWVRLFSISTDHLNPNTYLRSSPLAYSNDRLEVILKRESPAIDFLWLKIEDLTIRPTDNIMVEALPDSVLSNALLCEFEFRLPRQPPRVSETPIKELRRMRV